MDFKNNFKKLIKYLDNKKLDYLYRNYHLRPRGYYTTVKEFVKNQPTGEKIYYEIYPETTSKLDIPEHLLSKAANYLDYELTAAESAKYILKVSKGRIFTDCLFRVGVLSENSKLIGEVSLDLKQKKNEDISKSRILRQKYFINPEYFKGTVFALVGGGGAYINYYHWLIDSFSKLHYLKMAGLFDQVDWFYVPTIKYDYQLDSLLKFGIPKEKIIESTKFSHIYTDSLIVSSYTRGKHYHIHDWVIDFFYKNFPANYQSKYKSGRFFISRKDSSIRKVINEDTVTDILNEYDIKTILLSKLSFQEKIDLFANADLIISPSGAALTNLIFCKEGTTIVEIFGDQFVDFSHYYPIASKKKLNYYHFEGENLSDANSMTAGQHSNIKIDPNKLVDLIEIKLKLKRVN